ncbi:MAG: beta-ketoacyl-ACP synthase [Firmicutes bacterium]|nr:beta-ketoacyl-ACP synthase [Bacillota bacterium]
MFHRSVRIIATGKYIPPTVVTNVDLEEKLNLPSGWIEKKIGVFSRHYAMGETQSEMAAKAIRDALQSVNMTMEDIDCLVGANGAMEQAIPSNAALTKKALGLEKAIPAFDINSTCLSFLVAMDLVSPMVAAGQYRRVVIFSSDIASNALNWEHKESCILFGDGAAAVVIERDDNPRGSKIVASKLATYIEGTHLAEVKGGGTKLHPREYRETNKTDYLFHMEGEKMFRLSMKYIPDFFTDLLKSANCKMDDITMLIPHQASLTAMKLIQRKLGILDEKFMLTIQEYGNTIAASIPLALHDAISQGRVKRGDRIILFGTSAGLSIGGMVLEY